MGSPGHAIRMALRLGLRRRARDLYALISDLFDTLSEGSGSFNLGLWDPDDPGPVDLAVAQHALVARTQAELPQEGHWLDAGSGLGGPALQALAAHPQLRITGVNITPEQVQAARLRAEIRGMNDRVSFEEGDIQALSQAAATFDGAYALEAAFHCSDKAAFFAEARRVLKPGAPFALADFAALDSGLALWERMVLRLGLWTSATPPLLTFAQWEEAARAAGFEDIVITDLSPQVRPTLGAWAERIARHREALLARYPRLLVDAFALALRQILKRPHGAFRYVLLTARAP